MNDTTSPTGRQCERCSWVLDDESFTDSDSPLCRICEDPANRTSNTHIIYFEVAVTMDEMDGTPEQSAEIAYEQVRAALDGEQSQYGLPGCVEVRAREWYEGEAAA